LLKPGDPVGELKNYVHPSNADCGKQITDGLAWYRDNKAIQRPKFFSYKDRKIASNG